MYLRPVFAETDLDRIVALIAANSFGLLVTQGEDGPVATHVPFLVERRGDIIVLSAHLAAANPQCAALDGGTGLAVFGGPHAYISPGWYTTQPAVPTWDYVAAHVTGRLERVDQPDEVAAILRRLAAGDPNGFDLDALPAGFRDSMLAGIRAFRLVGVRVEGQWKMSQNRSPADRAGVAAALRASGETAVADLITATLPAGD